MGVMELRRMLIAGQEWFVPPAYQRCDYLQTTGYQSVIDTGVPGNDETLEIDYSYMPVDIGNYGGHIGNYVDENTACWRVIKSTSSYNQYMILTLGNRKAGSSASAKCVVGETVNGVRMDFHLSYGSYSVTSNDGRTASGTTVTDSSTRSTGNIALGCNRVLTNGTGTTKARIYSCRIKSHGKLIRNYVPCYRKSDNKAGFYDTVNCVFKLSIGPADFIAGYDAEPVEQIGAFTKGYEATLKPEAVNLFTITHNLGVTPRFCLIEIDDSTRQLTNSYMINAIIDFNVGGLSDSKTGACGYRYYYGNTYSSAIWLPDTKIAVTSNSITFDGYPYGTSRSRWDTDANYHVRVWG